MSQVSPARLDASEPGNGTEVMDEFLRRDRCPCCGAPLSQSRPKARSKPPAETLSASEHGRFLSGYTAHRVFFSYLECRVCSVFYCPVFYNQDQLSLLYANQPENMSEAPLEARRRTMETYAASVLRHGRPDGTFLELGADIGLFAEACARRGKFDRFLLYEPNTEVHNQVFARLKDHDLTIRASGFSAGDCPPSSVSTAIMIHVLDHLLDPQAMLRNIHTVLKPGGILFIVVHDARSLLARLLGNRWPPFTLQHPHLFSPPSIRRLLESTGFECVSLERTSNYFPAAYLANAAFSVVGLGPGMLPAWRQPMLKLRLGNLGVIARRPAE